MRADGDPPGPPCLAYLARPACLAPLASNKLSARRVLKTKKSRPVWEEMLRIAKSIPEPDLQKFPTNLTAQHDRYLYGNRGT
jgi:hypothetical protein